MQHISGGQACWPTGFTSVNGQTLALHMCAVPVEPSQDASAAAPPPPDPPVSREVQAAQLQQQRRAQLQKQMERQQQQDQEEREAYAQRLDMLEKMYQQPHSGLPMQPLYTRGAPSEWSPTGYLTSVDPSSPSRVLTLLSRKQHPRARQYEYVAKDENNKNTIHMGVMPWLEGGSVVELGGYGKYKAYPSNPY